MLEFPSVPNSLTVCILTAALLVSVAWPANASLFGKSNEPVPDWGLDAYKTHTPSYAGDAAAIILFDEYVETVDAQGRAVEREREAIRILKPQGRHNTCEVSYDVDEKVNYFRVWTIAADVACPVICTSGIVSVARRER